MFNKRKGKKTEVKKVRIPKEFVKCLLAHASIRGSSREVGNLIVNVHNT